MAATLEWCVVLLRLDSSNKNAASCRTTRRAHLTRYNPCCRLSPPSLPLGTRPGARPKQTRQGDERYGTGAPGACNLALAARCVGRGATSGGKTRPRSNLARRARQRTAGRRDEEERAAGSVAAALWASTRGPLSRRGDGALRGLGTSDTPNVPVGGRSLQRRRERRDSSREKR